MIVLVTAVVLVATTPGNTNGVAPSYGVAPSPSSFQGSSSALPAAAAVVRKTCEDAAAEDDEDNEGLVTATTFDDDEEDEEEDGGTTADGDDDDATRSTSDTTFAICSRTRRSFCSHLSGSSVFIKSIIRRLHSSL